MVLQHCTAAYLLCTVCTPCLLTGRCMQSDVPVYSTVRWSDLALFSIFENGHIPDCQVNFTLCFKAPKMDKIVFYLDKGKINFVFHF